MDRTAFLTPLFLWLTASALGLSTACESDTDPNTIARCWREGRRCANLLTNPGVDPAPAGISREEAVEAGFEPIVGPWVHGMTLGPDRSGNAWSGSLLFTDGGRAEAVNDEYLQEYHPKYETGIYRFSFWILEDSLSLEMNEWTVRLKLRDWWSAGQSPEDPGAIPDGVMCCWVANRTLSRPGDMKADVWREVSWEFGVPLLPDEWDSFEHIPECLDSDSTAITPYDSTTVIPGGYAIVVRPNGGESPTGGTVRLDDFAIEKTE